MPDMISGIWSFLVLQFAQVPHFAQSSVPFSIASSLINIGSAVWRWYSGRRALTYRLTVKRAISLRGLLNWLLHRETPLGVEATLRIWNSGRQAIRRDEFDNDTPIEIFFWDSTSPFIVTHRFQPANLRPEIAPRRSSIAIWPLLLNPKDSIELDLQFVIFRRVVFGTCRIVAIRWKTKYPGRTFWALVRIALALSLATLGLLVVADLQDNVPTFQRLLHDLHLQGIVQNALFVVSAATVVTS